MDSTSVQIYLHYTLHDAHPSLPEGFYHDVTPDPLYTKHIAWCILKVYPRTEDEKNRIVFTYQHPALSAPLPTMEIPMVREESGRFLGWFEIALALLPEVPLRVQVQEPKVAAQDWAEMNVILHGRELVLTSSDHSKTDVEFLGDWNDLDSMPSISFQDIGYQFSQGECLVRAGASLVHTGEPHLEVRAIRYDTQRQQFEYCLAYREGTDLHCFRRWYECFHDIAWNQALDLNRFDVVMLQLTNYIP